jgi:hypothetical protein
MRMKVGISRTQATADDGRVSATCEIEVEIPGGATDAEVLRVRDHWLGVCEATVDEELHRLSGGAGPVSTPAPESSREPAARPRAASSRSARPEYRATPPPRGRRDAAEDDRDHDRDGDDAGRPPGDGRQLLGWAAKQVPDAKGLVMSFGKKNGYPPKIVDWDDEQVRSAYRYARARQGQL